MEVAAEERCDEVVVVVEKRFDVEGYAQSYVLLYFQAAKTMVSLTKEMAAPSSG